MKLPFSNFKEVNIHPIFYNTLTDQAFEKCLICEISLLEGNIPYIIEKAIKRHPDFDIQDTVFELAVCMQCGEKMNEQMSVESRQKIAEYFMGQIDISTRIQDRISDPSSDPMNWISHCLVTGKAMKDCLDYQLFAECIGDKMVLHHFPWMLSGDALLELNALLSKETLGEMDNFLGDHFGLPPELKNLPLFV